MKLQDKYRAVFLGNEFGEEVLGDILQSCHYGETLDYSNIAQVAEYNVAVLILFKCGVLGDGTLPQIIKSFTAIKPEQKQENEQ